MTGMTPRPPSAEQIAEFAASRVAALARMPYMASYLFAVRVLDAPGLGTLAVDKFFRLYIDFAALTSMGWGVDECSQALLHEVSHLFGEHATMADEFEVPATCRTLANYATDASINDDLIAAGCTFLGNGTFITPSGIGEPDWRTWMYYYDALLAKMPPPPPGGGGGTDEGDHAGDGSGEGSSADGPGYAGCGSGAGGAPAPCELPEDDSLGGAAPAADAVERRIAAINASADIQAYVKARGSVPAGLVERATMVLTPTKTPWRRIVGSFVRRHVHTVAGTLVPDYLRRDRRRHNITLGVDGRKVILPGRANPKVRVALVRDTSRSMSRADLERTSAEIITVAAALRIKGKDLIVLDVDAQVAAVRQFRGRASLQEVAGRGGTDMALGIEAAARQDVDLVIVVTDGESGWPRVPLRVPVIACLVRPPGERDSTRCAARVPSFIKQVVVHVGD